ncbi:MAG: site-specific DNA-methyltransferase [Bacteroidales bacterium]|nr:site-specific DNA-methyltransferase [Bacteroidales bacterium]
MKTITNLNDLKKELVENIQQRVDDKILEQSNADLLKKLINNAKTETEAINIAALGTTYKRTGFHFDKRLEKISNDIKYKEKSKNLSFVNDESRPTHELIIGDNYDALQQLMITHKGEIDVIYIDPPYGKDKMGEFASTNYNNAITRDNLLSMLYPRLIMAKRLLTEDGVIFCSIDDKNQAYVKCLFDEVFREENFLFTAPRITKKGGKSTTQIQKNHDYLIAYANNDSIVFCGTEKDVESFTLEDEFVNERGKYKLTQTLDYDSLQYSKNMDYVITIDGKEYVPGGDKSKQAERHKGNHGTTDWVWRWRKQAVEWGLKEGLIVVKGNRLYTKTYLKCRKVNGKNELKPVDAIKAYTTLTFIDNMYSNDNGKKDLDKVFVNSNEIFKNPKPHALIKTLISMVCPKPDAVILDFFAGSGTTGQAVMELNREDGGNRTFILCQCNEITDTTPNGIAYDVTTKRLKRVMSGECYDGTNDFPWLKDHQPYRDNLNVYEIAKVSKTETRAGETAFDKIDQTCYGKEKKFANLQDKIAWVCQNFENATKFLEE